MVKPVYNGLNYRNSIEEVFSDIFRDFDKVCNDALTNKLGYTALLTNVYYK